MRKRSVAIAGALVLVLAGIFVWSAKATEPIGPVAMCRITDECLTINGDPNYCWDDHARGRHEPCSQGGLADAVAGEQPFTTCYYINGRRYCK